MKAGSSDVQAGWRRLMPLMEDAWQELQHNVTDCPAPMRAVFAAIRSGVQAKWPHDVDVVQYTAVSGFLFLRFIVPAILNPKCAPWGGFFFYRVVVVACVVVVEIWSRDLLPPPPTCGHLGGQEGAFGVWL